MGKMCDLCGQNPPIWIDVTGETVCGDCETFAVGGLIRLENMPTSNRLPVADNLHLEILPAGETLTEEVKAWGVATDRPHVKIKSGRDSIAVYPDEIRHLIGALAQAAGVLVEVQQ
ncbi:MAG: hypothetical protein GY832_32080 [Chloroflexi bacterium]|nr:hypothetical protein [Chloroflexota bacterium]